MDPRIRQTISTLENNGWSFSGSADVTSDWWFSNMYLLVSTWSPVGTHLYLTLLVDPQSDKSKEVWAAGFSKEIPDYRHFTYLIQVTLKDMGRMNAATFVKELNTLVLTAH